MSERSKFDFVEFLNHWRRLAGLLAGIASAISSPFAFASESFWLSVATILVGCILISLWLIGIIRQRVERNQILLPPSARLGQRLGRHLYPDWVRALAVLGLILLTVATALWSWIGINAQIRKSTLPKDAVQLPGAESAGLSVSIEPRMWMYVGLINDDVDRTAITQTVASRNIIRPGDFSPRFAKLNAAPTLWVVITGRSVNEPVQISNKVPIKVLSYQPIADVVDLAGFGEGGGGDVWLLGAEISDRVISNPDQTIWATYTSDLRERLIQAQGGDLSYQFDSLPSEVQKAISSETTQLPDYFLLENNERMVISVATFFKKPGIYRLQLGVEYLYRGYRAVAWADPPIDVYVPKDYYLWWSVLESDTYELGSMCTLHPRDIDHGYQCISMAWASKLHPVAKSIKFSPDGALLASGRSDGAVSLWDTVSGTELHTFKGQHFGEINSVAFSPDGAMLASASEVIKLWNVANGSELLTLKGHVSKINSVAFSPDGVMLASASEVIKLWNVANGAELLTLNGGVGWIRSVAFSPDGQMLASGSSDGSVILWSAMNGRMVHRLGKGMCSVQSVAFSPDGQKLASASSDGTVRLWDIATGKELRSFADSNSVSSVAFSPSRNILATATGVGTIVWDEVTGEQVQILNDDIYDTRDAWGDPIGSITFSPDGTKLASGYASGVKIWDTAGWVELFSINLQPMP